METTAKKSSWHGKKQVELMIYTGLLMLIGACLGGGTTNTILPVIAEKYGWSIDLLRTIAGIGTLSVFIGSFLSARIIMKKGPKLANAITLFGTVLFCIIYGWTNNFVIFIIMIILIGMFSGGYYQAGVTALTANWWPTMKGLVFGITTMGIPLMDIVWQPFIPKAFAAFGTGWTMTGVAVIIAIIGIWGLFIKNTPEEAGEYPDGDAEHAEEIAANAKALREYKSPFTFGKVLKTKETWIIALPMGLCFMSAMTFIAGIVPRLLSVGYSYEFATLVLIVAGACSIAGSFLIGLMDQKLGTKKAAIIFACLLFVSMILALFHANSPFFVWISAIIFFGSNGGCANLIPSFVAGSFGRWDYAAAYQVVGPITSIFGGIGVMCTGLFAGNYQTMFIMDLVLIAIGAVIIIVSKYRFVGKADTDDQKNLTERAHA